MGPAASKWLPGPRTWAAVAACLAFSNALPGGFHFDDKTSVVENREIRRLDPDRLLVSYRPLVKLSLALNYAASGLRSSAFIATNIAFHALNAWLLASLAGVYGRRRWPAQPARTQNAALVAGILFAVHPLATESIDVVIGRSDLLAASGVLFALWQHLREGRLARLLACAGLVLALSAKEQGAVFAALAVLLDWSLAGDGLAGLKRALRRSAVYFALLLAGAAAIYLRGVLRYQWPYAWGDYLVGQLAALPSYLRLTFWPINLNLDHDLAVPVGLTEIRLVVGGAILVACLAAIGRAAPRTPVRLGIVWYLVSLTPTALVPLRDVMAEHRLYLPLAGVALAAGLELAAKDWGRWMWGSAVGAVGVCLLLLTWNRNRDYAGEERLWRDTVAKSPAKGRPHNNYGVALLDQGDFPEALKQFRLARRLDPSYHDAVFNLAVVLEQTGAREQAVQVLQQGLERFPHSGRIQTNLGLLMLEAGRREEARRLFTEAAGRPARDARAANNLARMYLEEGRPALARPWADKAIRREPDLAAAYLNRAAIARVEGRFEPARADLERARALEPGLPEVALEEGYLAAARGDWNGAIERYRAVLAARPNHVPALIALAQAYRELGRDAEAAQALLRAKTLAANS